MGWMTTLGYSEAHDPPSAHNLRCDGILLIAEDDSMGIFIYCANCRLVWWVSTRLHCIGSRRSLMERVETLYTGVT